MPKKIPARQTATGNTQTQTLGVVSEVPMGDWNSVTQYQKLNTVRYNGATYIAKKDNQGQEPTVAQGWQEIWQAVAYDGRGISQTEITYQSGLSGTIPPTGEWVSEIPEVPQGQYLWTRTIYTFTDKLQTVSYSVSLQGLNFTQQDRDDIDRITDAIPSTASESNPLATHDFVNSSINNLAAYYITSNATGDAFPTKAKLLSATTFYSGGQARVPTQNDYAIVLADESQPLGADGKYPTTRYSYQGGTYPNGQWSFQYVVNNTAFTQAQVDAINSGITSDTIPQLTKRIQMKFDNEAYERERADETIFNELDGKIDKVDGVATNLTVKGSLTAQTINTEILIGRADETLINQDPRMYAIDFGNVYNEMRLYGKAERPTYSAYTTNQDGGLIDPEEQEVALVSDVDQKVNKSGDTMTGKLTVPQFSVDDGGVMSTFIGLGRYDSTGIEFHCQNDAGVYLDYDATIQANSVNSSSQVGTAVLNYMAREHRFDNTLISKNDNDFISHGNEFNFGTSATSEIYINYRSGGIIGHYRFCNGDGAGSFADIRAANLYDNEQRVYSPNNPPSTTSDERVKEDIELVDTQRCLADVERLPVKRYKYKDYALPPACRDTHRTGFIAQDVEKVFPKDIIYSDEEYPVLDENGNKVTGNILDENGNIQYENLLDENGKPIIESETVDENGEKHIVYKLDKTKPKQRVKTFKMENVRKIRMDDGLATLWAAVQELSKQFKEMRAEIAELKNK